MRNDFVKIAVYQVRKLDLAVLICTCPQRDEEDAREVWLPLSQLHRISLHAVEGDLPHVTIEMPRWLVKAKGLEDFEI